MIDPQAADSRNRPIPPPRVTALVLNWNRTDDSLAAVQSLLESSYPALDVMAIDNGSDDQSLDRLRAQLPKSVSLKSNGINLGFAGGNNVGIDEAFTRGSEYVFLLNSDARVTETTVEGLVRVMESQSAAGACGPTILTGEDPPRVESRGGMVDLRTGRIRHLGFGMDWEQPEQEPAAEKVDLVSGCAFLVRRAAFETVGVMDERFFCYLEEADWCLRMAAAGFHIMHVPAEVVNHAGGASLGGVSSAIRIYFGVRNHLLLLKKNGASESQGPGLVRTSRVLLLWLLFLFFSSGIGKGAGLKMYFKGLSDYRRGRFGGAMLTGGQEER